MRIWHCNNEKYQSVASQMEKFLEINWSSKGFLTLISQPEFSLCKIKLTALAYRHLNLTGVETKSAILLIR